MGSLGTIPHTEVAVVPLVKGADPLDPNSEAGKITRDAVRLTAEQPGYIRMIWGVKEEDPSIMVMLVDWEDISYHKAFEAQPFYEPFMQGFDKMVDGPLLLFHVTFDCADGVTPTTKLRNPVTDVIMGFFPTDQAADVIKATSTVTAQNLASTLAKNGVAPQSCASGWSMEDEVEEERAGKGKEKLWVAILGWEDTTQRQKGNEAVAANIEWIRKHGGELQASHVKFVEGPGF